MQVELKQLKCFVTASECGSIMGAAEKLYTTQPNVSKIIRSLEKELGCELFKRTNRGIILTIQGQKLFQHAQTVIRNSEIMFTVAKGIVKEHVSIASYPSNMISHLFTDYYKEFQDESFTLELLEGNTESVIEYVEEYRAEIGILYVGQNQFGALNHWLFHKKLEFHSLAQKEPCIYVGPNNPFYDKDSIDAEDIKKLKFIQPSNDYFSVENHLEPLDPALSCIDTISPVVTTNSDHTSISFLLHTDLCSFGIKLMSDDYRQYDIHPLSINEIEQNLHLGYVCHQNTPLSSRAEAFVLRLSAFLETLEKD